MYQPPKHYAVWKKAVTKNTLYGPIYKNFSEKV